MRVLIDFGQKTAIIHPFAMRFATVTQLRVPATSATAPQPVCSAVLRGEDEHPSATIALMVSAAARSPP